MSLYRVASYRLIQVPDPYNHEMPDSKLRPGRARAQMDLCRSFALWLLTGDGLSRVLTGMSADQWNEMMADNGWNEVELRDSRYNQVVHMVSIADASTGRRRHFSSHEGMDLHTARQLDLGISQVRAESVT